MANIEEFLSSIERERTELKKDLAGLHLNTPTCKVGDFGCGWGYITWCLMLEIGEAECVGIDLFDPMQPPYVTVEDVGKRLLGIPIPPSEEFTIENVQRRFEEVIDEIKSGIIRLQDGDLFNDIRDMIVDEDRFPVFQKGDLITGENLTSNHYDLIYCKRVLYNIYSSEGREVKLEQAINHIANSLKYDGWFCFVEINPNDKTFRENYLEHYLAQAGFKLKQPRTDNRPYQSHEEYPYLIYHCQKISTIK